MKADYTAHLRVRSYECDSLGHVNNSIYLQYLQQITHEAQGQSPNPKGFWDVRALSIEYLAPAVDRDELEVETWVVERHAMGIARGYRIKRVSDSAPVVAARLDWVFRDPGGAALPVPEVGSPQGNLPSPLKPFFPPGDNSSTAFRWRHRVRRYELDASNRVAPAVYLNWLEEATYDYSARVGWDIDRMRQENFIVLQYRRDTQFFAPAKYADELEMISRLIEVRRVRGTWVHELYRKPSNELVVRDYSTGAFLDWQGKLRPPPAEMIDALIKGKLTSKGGELRKNE